ncbi:MAG: hypothetical protein AAF203_06010, partial [Pseudomonadota bacterium]
MSSALHFNFEVIAFGASKNLGCKGILFNQVGAYAQISKRFLADRLKLTASGRYDRNENFDDR